VTPFEFFACLLLISISAFMSSSEIALFSLSRFQLRSLKERFRTAHRKIKRLLTDPGGLLVTILIVNEIVNISLSTIVTHAISRGWTNNTGTLAFLRNSMATHLPDWALQTLVGTLLTAPIVLFLGEVTPKAIGVKANQIVAPMNVGPLTWIYTAFKPVRFVLRHFIAFATEKTQQNKCTQSSEKNPSEAILKEEEFLSMVEEGHKEGTIQQSELELIKNVFELDDRTVTDVFTPLSKVYSLPVTTPLKTALTAMKGRRFSRVPIYGANRKQIVGVIYSKDLLLSTLTPEPSGTVATLMRKPITVSPSLRLNALFRRLKQYRTHMAVVELTPGESLGVVTMSDVLDALFEDVVDDDSDTDQSRRLTK